MAAHYYHELLKYFARVMQDYDAAADIVQEAYALTGSPAGRAAYNRITRFTLSYCA
ncbi:hypothetical protein [Nitrosomonas europaea]|uniref:hypothetical protein n=1 Tax=Nitrosomonas europaea TaxID=915 RepID=UPI0023F440CE|nr:hypothetical protein [Nitrosomonas europaea]